jgi:hypothetical protein
MKNKNKKYIIAMNCEKKNNDIDILTFGNGKPRYFNNNKKAVNFLENLYNNGNLDYKPFFDDGVILMRVH